MLFNSLAFALFFPVVWGGVRLLSHRWQNRLLLFAAPSSAAGGSTTRKVLRVYEVIR